MGKPQSNFLYSTIFGVPLIAVNIVINAVLIAAAKEYPIIDFPTM